MEPDDKEIIAEIRGGNTNAYASLVRKYQEKILRLSVSLLYNRTAAEDASQEIFIKAYRSLSEFKGESSFSTWIYRIASNHCMDILRKESRRRSESWESLLEREGEKIHDLFASTPNAQSALENRDLVDKILQEIPEKQRMILVLREVQGLTYEEIAQVEGSSVDAVKSRLKRARENLRDKLRHFLRPTNV